MKPEHIQLYTSWRDDFLGIIGGKTCKECADPQKETKKLDYENPFNCECRCHRIENMMSTAENIEAELKLYLSNAN